ncbi:hypothetical protein [Dyadobacter bucti]|uniref:hypothetical protein n=1 Tax=Dyadobacter bucti TaxID=2572203 RepID=UPI003F6FB67B
MQKVKHGPSPDGKGPWKAADRGWPGRRSKGSISRESPCQPQAAAGNFRRNKSKGKRRLFDKSRTARRFAGAQDFGKLHCGQFKAGLSAANYVQAKKVDARHTKSPA